MPGILLATAAALFWGISYILARIGLQEMKPLAGTILSLLSSVILIAPLSLIVNFDSVASLPLTALLWFGMVGVINYAIGRQLRYMSLNHIGVARATPIFSVSPLFAMVLAVVFINEQVNPAIIGGTVSIIVGLTLLVTDK